MLKEKLLSPVKISKNNKSEFKDSKENKLAINLNFQSKITMQDVNPAANLFLKNASKDSIGTELWTWSLNNESNHNTRRVSF